jgi:hypothetical protein
MFLSCSPTPRVPESQRIGERGKLGYLGPPTD